MAKKKMMEIRREIIEYGNTLIGMFSILSGITTILCLHMHEYLYAICCVIWAVIAYKTYHGNKRILKAADIMSRMSDTIHAQQERLNELLQTLLEIDHGISEIPSNQNNQNNQITLNTPKIQNTPNTKNNNDNN